jgi:RNA polymerase sigma factor (TIGR02999 family)
MSPRAAGADEVTDLLAAWSRGDHAALERLMPLVERELQLLAHRYLRRERRDHTLQTTALVNEAYLRLAGQRDPRWQNRAHFFGIAASMMRRILIDHARRIAYKKRGGGAARVELDEACLIAPERSAELIAVDEALAALAEVDERKARVVELRYFAGLTLEETAAVLGVQPDTVSREWRRAKAFLRRELAGR